MKKGTFIPLFLLFVHSVLGQYISVDNTYTAQELVENVLFSNSCSGTISNVSVSGGDFGSSGSSWGYFNANGSNFSFQDGIILSTGKISNAVGPNNFISDDTASNWGGDSDLNQALNINNSINATVLEFDFVPIGNKISFDYIFSSEEYHGTATCTYSDGFAFLLQEVGASSYQNLAVIPGTTIPVKVTSVHPDIPGGCSAQNEEYFDAFNGSNHPTNYNGQTVVLTAEADVVPNTAYHIKLVIADEGNYRYDSAIFLLGGSFAYEVDLGDDRTFSNENPVCFDETLTLDASGVTGNTYQWYKDGVTLSGETNSTLTLSPPFDSTFDGSYSVIIDGGSACEKEGNITLEFTEEIQLTEDNFAFCDTDGDPDGIMSFSSSDFNDLLDVAFPNLDNKYTVALFETANSSSPIIFPYENLDAYSQVLYAKVTNTNCYDAFEITLQVDALAFDNQNITICEGETTTLQCETGYTYLWNTDETTASITVDTAGTYSVQIFDDNCSTTQYFYVTSSEPATIENITVVDFTENNSAVITVSGNGNYSFSLDGENFQESPYFDELEEGEYTATVKDENGCGTTTQVFYVLNYPRFFTPNGDGINDFWNIKNLEKRNLNANKIYIFDRYGKLITQIRKNEAGWNGTSNGYNLPASDYWFTLELSNGRTVKGHFSLLR